MQENYLISILGRQQVDGETGEVQVTTLGSYVKKEKIVILPIKNMTAKRTESR